MGEQLRAGAIHELSGRTVRIVVPAEVHSSLESMQQVTKEVMTRLGCAPCHSGWDLRFELEREFIVDARLKVRGATEALIR